MESRKPPRDPVLEAIRNAPLDDEEFTDAQRREIAAAKRKGRYITTEALRARLARRRKR